MAAPSRESRLESRMEPRPVSIRDDYIPSRKLEGKVALVTGGDSGIGRAVALTFAKEGAKVAIAYLDEHEDVKELMNCLRKEGDQNAINIAGDLSEDTFAKEVVQKTLEAFGRIDILVNNCGGQQALCDKFEELSESQVRKTFEVNVFSTFYITKEVLRVMPDEGCIINNASVEAYGVGVPGMVDYAAAKGAIVSFTYALAQAEDVLSKRIRVNAVAPGPVWTPLNASIMPPERLEAGVKGHTWMKRIAQPWEVAPSFLFLACNAMSSFMTGQVLHPNGGAAVHG